MSAFNWTCPHCERAVTISNERLSVDQHTLDIENSDGQRTLSSRFFVCPNPDCKRFSLTATLQESEWARGDLKLGKLVQYWNLIPDSHAKQFPNYVPAPILEDYREACLIRALSPKASATLSRRCLQGMIRDFWKVKPGRLVEEIAAIEPRVDPVTWSAIEAVRKLGNIGAHMEKDINVIVEVDPSEADLLIELVETLIREWYVGREERTARMNSLVVAAAAKKLAANP